MTAATLAEFPYVLTTRAGYASGPPPGYRVFDAHRQLRAVGEGRVALGRLPGETDAAPGRSDACPREKPDRAASFAATPIVAEESEWSTTTVEGGEEATVTLDLPTGVWDLSLQYDATRPVTLADDADRLDFILPANLDYRGTAPFWPAGRIEVAGGEPARITATVDDPPLTGRLMGADSVAHLGALAATSAEPAREGCRGYVDWYVR